MSHSPPTTAPHSLHQEDDLQVGSIVFWGIITVVIVIASVFGLHALTNWYEDQLLPERLYGTVNAQADNEAARQEGLLLAPPAWIDKEKGSVSLPIQQAMTLTLEEFQAE